MEGSNKTRSSKDECSIGSNNHLRSTDLFMSEIIDFKRSTNLEENLGENETQCSEILNYIAPIALIA